MKRRSILPGVGRALLCAAVMACLCPGASVLARGGGKSLAPAASASAPRRAPARERCDENSKGYVTDFSGLTYEGQLTYRAGGIESPVTATLTVTGNEFTLTPTGGQPLTGRITAQTTCKYTGVALMFNDPTRRDDPKAPPPPPLPVLSLRACRTRKGVDLRSRERNVFEFISERVVEGTGPSVRDEWGKCGGRWRLQGNRPL